LTNLGSVLIGGRHHGIAGTVTMDQLLVDCADEEIQVGEEVVLIGNQGDETIGAEELGRLIGTIGYEIVSRIGDRVPRRYG
jgi:alanine racemase